MPEPDHVKFSHSACRTRDLSGKWTSRQENPRRNQTLNFHTPHSTQAPSVICGELGRETSDADRPELHQTTARNKPEYTKENHKKGHMVGLALTLLPKPWRPCTASHCIQS
jgi:hypothetical protein